jgi:hypothetical protein
MSKSIDLFARWVLPFVFVVACGCGAAPEQVEEAPPPSPISADESDEPEFNVWSFGVLDQATREPRLPYLIDASGVRLDTPCYDTARQLKPWETERGTVLAKLEQYAAGIADSLLVWFEDVLLGGDGGTEGWSVSYSEPMIVHAPDAKLRLAGDQQCVDQSGALPDGSKTVTTLFGAKTLHFKSSQPLDKKLIKRLRKASKKAKVWLKPLKAYRRAVDEDGDVVSGPGGEKLYVSPDGRLVPRKQVPKGAKRRIYELELNSWQPIWFAFGDLPEDAWAKEFSGDRCEVNLVYDDATPRPLDCDDLVDVGLGVSRGGGDRVTVKATVDGYTAKGTVPFGEVLMMQVSGRVVLWIKPRKILEGAMLRVNSLVLDPQSAGDAPPESFPQRKWAKD